MLELASAAHSLTEEHKVIQFEAGFKEEKAINYSINSKIIWDALPENKQAFDSYYNTFSSFMNKYNILLLGNHRKVQISQTKSKRYNSNRARSKYSRQRSSGGKDGMRPRTYNPYAMVRNAKDNFKPETRIYSMEEYSNLTSAHKNQIHELKLKNG